MFDNEEVVKTRSATFELYEDYGDDDIAEWIEQCHDEFYQQKLKFVEYHQDLLDEVPNEDYRLEVDMTVKLIKINEDELDDE